MFLIFCPLWNLALRDFSPSLVIISATLSGILIPEKQIGLLPDKVFSFL
jgi:hypothetical protein